VGGIGTGGTISGAGRYLKEKAAEAGREMKIVCPDPVGSIYFDVFHHGEERREPGIYRVEGIGHDFMVGTLDMSVIDDVFEVTDRESFLTARRLVREEGIFCGGSAGTAVFGALKVARELGPGKVVVVIIPDSGDRYITKYFNDEWMKDMGLFDIEERLGTVRVLIEAKGRHVEFAERSETIAEVASRMGQLGFSQMPLRPNGSDPLMMVHELDLLRALASGSCKGEDRVVDAAAPLNGIVSINDPLSKVQRIFDKDEVAVLVEGGNITGIISKIDVVEFLAHRS
jgi:cystathionine beta-synthase